MIYNNLLKYSFEFAKKAGLLKVPEKTLREVEEWALSVYFTRMCNSYFLPKLKEFGLLDSKENTDIFSFKSNNYYQRKELEEVLLECKRFITKKISANTTFYIKSPFSDKLFSFGAVFLLEDSPLRKGYWNNQEIKYQNNIEDDDIFKLGFLTLWFGEKDIGYPYEATKIETKANEIKRTVRHELQHMMQTLIKCEHGQIYSDQVQLGRNIRETNFDVEKTNLPHELIHSHMDVEFYTDLNDSVDEFKSAIINLPKIIHRLYFNAWVDQINIEDFFIQVEKLQAKIVGVGKKRLLNKKEFLFYFSEEHILLKNNNNIFWSWKEHEPEKYKKAVKIFYNEVQDLL